MTTQLHQNMDSKSIKLLVRNYIANVKFEELMKFFYLYEKGPQFMGILKNLDTIDILRIFFSRTVFNWKSKYSGLYDTILEYFKETTFNQEDFNYIKEKSKEYRSNIMEYTLKEIGKHEESILLLLKDLFDSQIYVYNNQQKLTFLNYEKQFKMFEDINRFFEFMLKFTIKKHVDFFVIFEDIKYPFKLDHLLLSIYSDNVITKRKKLIEKLLKKVDIVKGVSIKDSIFINDIPELINFGKKTISILNFCQLVDKYETLYYIFENNYHKNIPEKVLKSSFKRELSLGLKINTKYIDLLIKEFEEFKNDKVIILNIIKKTTNMNYEEFNNFFVDIAKSNDLENTKILKILLNLLSNDRLDPKYKNFLAYKNSINHGSYESFELLLKDKRFDNLNPEIQDAIIHSENFEKLKLYLGPSSKLIHNLKFIERVISILKDATKKLDAVYRNYTADELIIRVKNWLIIANLLEAERTNLFGRMSNRRLSGVKQEARSVLYSIHKKRNPRPPIPIQFDFSNIDLSNSSPVESNILDSILKTINKTTNKKTENYYNLIYSIKNKNVKDFKMYFDKTNEFVDKNYVIDLIKKTVNCEEMIKGIK